MNPARWPGEPLIQRLTQDEIEEIQWFYLKRERARKRRREWKAPPVQKQPQVVRSYVRHVEAR